MIVRLHQEKKGTRPLIKKPESYPTRKKKRKKRKHKRVKELYPDSNPGKEGGLSKPTDRCPGLKKGRQGEKKAQETRKWSLSKRRSKDPAGLGGEKNSV